jgi:hypothetical protein
MTTLPPVWWKDLKRRIVKKMDFTNLENTQSNTLAKTPHWSQDISRNSYMHDI